MINRINCQEMQDFLVEEARLEDVVIDENSIKIVYLLDGDEDFQRYHARRIQERNDGSTD